MKMLLDVNAKVGMKDIFKPKIWDEHLHEISNANEVRVVNLQQLKMSVIGMMYTHHNIHKYTWMSPDGKTTIF
jgi:hypothetical protein